MNIRAKVKSILSLPKWLGVLHGFPRLEVPSLSQVTWSVCRISLREAAARGPDFRQPRVLLALQIPSQSGC